MVPLSSLLTTFLFCDQDIELTHMLKGIQKVIDVWVLDNLVTGDEVTVFSERGLLQEKNLIKKIPKLGGKPAPDRGVVPSPFYTQKQRRKNHDSTYTDI